MIHPLELFISLRYTRAKRRNQFVSFISVMATLGIVLGVAAMITVLSVMNGFGKELRDRILSVVSHVTVESASGRLKDWQQIREKYRTAGGVVGIAPYVNGQGLLVKSRNTQGIVFRGINPVDELRVSRFSENLIKGSLENLKPGERGAIVGKTLAGKLNLKIGSAVVLIHDQRTNDQSSPRLHRLIVVGIFQVGMHQQDSGLILLHIDDAMNIVGADNEVSGLRFRLDDAYNARAFSFELEQALSEYTDVNHWMNRHSNFFIALEDQKRIMFIVLMLVVSVAAFNIVSTLVMMVTDKQSDIAILRTIGMTPFSILLIFIFQGLLVAGIGIGIGVGLGVLIASNSELIVHFIERILDLNFLSPEIYPITDLPSEILLSDIINIVLAASIASFLSTLYPAWRAARTQPAMALRYE